jgi:hypothetical protein
MRLRKGALAGVAMVGTVTTTFALPGSQAGAARSGGCAPDDSMCMAMDTPAMAAAVRQAMAGAMANRAAELAQQTAAAQQSAGAQPAISAKGYPTGARYQSMSLPVTCPGQAGVKADGAQFELFDKVAQLTARCDGRVRVRVKAKYVNPDNSVVIADTSEHFDFADVAMDQNIASACYYVQRPDTSWLVGQWAASWPEIHNDCNL